MHWVTPTVFFEQLTILFWVLWIIFQHIRFLSRTIKVSLEFPLFAKEWLCCFLLKFLERKSIKTERKTERLFFRYRSKLKLKKSSTKKHCSREVVDKNHKRRKGNSVFCRHGVFVCNVDVQCAIRSLIWIDNCMQ